MVIRFTPAVLTAFMTIMSCHPRCLGRPAPGYRSRPPATRLPLLSIRFPGVDSAPQRATFHTYHYSALPHSGEGHPPTTTYGSHRLLEVTPPPTRARPQNHGFAAGPQAQHGTLSHPCDTVAHRATGSQGVSTPLSSTQHQHHTDQQPVRRTPRSRSRQPSPLPFGLPTLVSPHPLYAALLGQHRQPPVLSPPPAHLGGMASSDGRSALQGYYTTMGNTRDHANQQGFTSPSPRPATIAPPTSPRASAQVVAPPTPPWPLTYRLPLQPDFPPVAPGGTPKTKPGLVPKPRLESPLPATTTSCPLPDGPPLAFSPLPVGSHSSSCARVVSPLPREAGSPWTFATNGSHQGPS